MSTDTLTALFVENIASHFDGSTIDGDVVHTGVEGLTIQGYVNRVDDRGSYTSVSLFFQVWGGRLGATPVFASMSGYAGGTDDDARAAVITGSCNWCCTFGPMFRAALSGQEAGDIEEADVTVHGQRFRLLVDGLDRVLSFGEGDHSPDRTRERLGGDPHFARALASSAGCLPVLPHDEVSVLSVFVGDSEANRTLEVKVHGRDWPSAHAFFDGCEPEPPGAVVLLRELAVLVPVGPEPELTRAGVEATLAGFRVREDITPSWRGWRSSGGRLGS
ncbi:MAG: hypothetical protein KC912_10305, partial [Proteobacteria bacterium]|nr:hypothetical protein [Pseudomonadota bacterium]